MLDENDLENKIKALIDYELNKGNTDRNHVYDVVAYEIGVHRVMVRKVARQLLVDYVEKLQILGDGLLDFHGYCKRHPKRYQ